ncbi:hypothetical protein [Streptomyces sp. DSM 118878]
MHHANADVTVSEIWSGRRLSGDAFGLMEFWKLRQEHVASSLGRHEGRHEGTQARGHDFR